MVPYQFQPIVQGSSNASPWGLQPLLQQAGLWDGFTNMPQLMGDRPRGQQYETDWARLNGYQLGAYDANGQEYYALRDPNGNIVATHQQQNGAVTFRDLVTGSAFIGAMALGIPAAASAAGYGGAAAAGGVAGTAAPAAGSFVPAGSTGLTVGGTATGGYGGLTGGGLLTGGAVPASGGLTIAGAGGTGAGLAGAGTGALTIAGASAPAGASFVTPGLGSTIGTAAPAAAGGGMTMGNYLTAAQLASGLYGSYQQGQAAEAAAAAQQAAAQQGITAQQQALQQVRADLSPYTQAGPGALKAQQDLAGLNGPEAQQAAIAALQASPQFTAQQQLGEERILANASATGGLRGGNVQAALAQFSPALLADTISQQYSRLGGLVQVGQNSAAGVGTATLGTANNTSNLLQQQGAAAAGGALAQGRTQLGYVGALTQALGMYAGLKGGF